MADLYDSNEESEDMSSFLQILLHNSSSSAPTTDTTTTGGGGGGFLSGGGTVAESSSSFNFSDPSCFLFTKHSDEILNTSATLKNSGSSCEGSEACELPAPPRGSSSKRSRAAEVHNLSEKRRRSRINEKLKALQNLIPNSNKTDKASMLDEAIEYLKQLQLQVQMLTMRNGLSLHPSYSLGSLQSMLAPTAGLELDEGNVLLNANRGADTLSRGRDIFMQTTLETIDHSTSTQPMLMPSSMPNNTNSGVVPSFVPSMQNHYGLLNHLASSKVIIFIYVWINDFSKEKNRCIK
ncbi:hypothetical protein BUALT_Bualt08G0047700 [Buddleja alternifolia]|uniref:BHLH domain-containing protein n=1 Tax=Buddleja alternifolia TaxID=168488 RepID=A0AAV6X556_9LAMI|nr:hypothetical protein BUALT_Bualt08G0047700 [Buddleja alternifolia]